jgi:sialic acid synthase SpsE
MDKALNLVRAGAQAGVDAVKFQVIDPDQLSDKSVSYGYVVDGKRVETNMQEMFQQLAFTEQQWQHISDACKAEGVHFFATVDYLDGVDMLERIGVPAHKMGAWDCTYRPLIEHIAATRKPLFVDLGPTTQSELDDIVRWFDAAGGDSLLLLHDFHTDVDSEMNLAAVRYLSANYPWPAGYSAPGLDHDLDFAALALGAGFIEKRLVLSRSEPAFHVHESLEPSELKEWVDRMRHVERAIGHEEIRPSQRDLDHSIEYYRSICALKPIKAGEVLTRENLGGKRPGTGLPTAKLPEIWGRTAARDLNADTLLSEEDVA